MKTVNYEIYTCHPETKEGGWDIKFVNIIGETRDERIETLHNVPDFDCVILFNYKTDSTQEEIEMYNNGTKYFFDKI